MESIWLRPERSARGPVPEHSRAEIARAAVTLADQGGLACSSWPARPGASIGGIPG